MVTSLSPSDPNEQAQNAAREAQEAVRKLRNVESTLDLATILGLLLAIGLVMLAITMSGSLRGFIDLPSILLVLGATLAVTTACYSFGDIVQTFRHIGKTLVYSVRDASQAATTVLGMAEIARKGGILTLQKFLPKIAREVFFAKSISMVVDNLGPTEIERIMRKELSTSSAQLQRSVNVLRRAADVSPAMGLIGTLVGLVQMLSFLDDASKIGPSMALALLTTLYGALLSNLLFLPLATKLERTAGEEELVNTIYLVGSTSIARKENPRRLEMVLNTILPADKRIQYFKE
ncbi:MAG: motility protein A [Dongiaceae bacterium]